MFQFFDNIINFIDILVNYFQSTVENVINLFDRAGKGLAFITLTFGFMPNFIGPVLLSLVSIAVIKLILTLGSR